MARNKVLIVDDEKIMRILHSKFLSSAGCELYEAENCDQALYTVKNHDIDVVLLDIMMPGMNGVECFGEIKKINRQTEIVMMTSVTDIHTGVSMMKKGAFDYIVKPVKKKALLNTIQRAIKKKESAREMRPFKVHQTILLNTSGLVMFYKNFDPDTDLDEDFFGGMITAINMFIQDTLPTDGGLKSIEHGDHKILLERGRDFFLAVIGKGEDLSSVRQRMGATATRIDSEFGEIIGEWQGETDDFLGVEKVLEGLQAY
ncbi:MAG: response regulator [Desulfobacterales bacterium]|nr:response regulator [Desulfobacterales bacterium]